MNVLFVRVFCASTKMRFNITSLLHEEKSRSETLVKSLLETSRSLPNGGGAA